MLAQRVASAAIGVPVILLLIWAGGNWYTAAVAAGLAIASIEFNHDRREWLSPVSVLTALLVAGIAIGADTGRYEWWIWLAAAMAVPAIAAVVMPTEHGVADDIAWLVGGVVYVGYLGSFLVLLREADDGREWVYLTVLSTFAVDTAAYFTGRAIGKRLLAPTISPKKTWEGFFGGCIAGAAAVIIAHQVFGLPGAVWQIALLAPLFPIAAAAGDLVESKIKRVMQIKDASDLIPGHGGVLDRLDSILFTFPLVYVWVAWVIGA